VNIPFSEAGDDTLRQYVIVSSSPAWLGTVWNAFLGRAQRLPPHAIVALATLAEIETWSTIDDVVSVAPFLPRLKYVSDDQLFPILQDQARRLLKRRSAVGSKSEEAEETVAVGWDVYLMSPLFEPAEVAPLLEEWNAGLGALNMPHNVRLRLVSPKRLRLVMKPLEKSSVRAAAAAGAAGAAERDGSIVEGIRTSLQWLSSKEAVHWLNPSPKRGKVSPRNGAAKQTTQTGGAVFNYESSTFTERAWQRKPTSAAGDSGFTIGGCAGTQFG
jgi:hypothetical protein